MTDVQSVRALQGPRRPGKSDIAALNRLFSESFTDRYRRDGLLGVRVPQLNPQIWRYAILDAGEGAMLWFDEKADLVAFNIAHRSGAEGWMGPLAVRSDSQGFGAGKMIVQTALDWLRRKGASTVGLETMPRTVDNIGFYSRLGFVPQYLTLTMTGDARPRPKNGRLVPLSELSRGDQEELVERCRARLDRTASGYDYSREFHLTIELGIGDAIVVEKRSEIVGFALWHSAPLAQDRLQEELRVLKLFADSPKTFEQLAAAAEVCAAEARLPRVVIRCQTAFGSAYEMLIRRGYAVRWSDLRMMLRERPEPVLPPGEILFSNWEI
jgi:GNAT superfamily N-acetyltransferase